MMQPFMDHTEVPDFAFKASGNFCFVYIERVGPFVDVAFVEYNICQGWFQLIKLVPVAVAFECTIGGNRPC